VFKSLLPRSNFRHEWIAFFLCNITFRRNQFSSSSFLTHLWLRMYVLSRVSRVRECYCSFSSRFFFVRSSVLWPPPIFFYVRSVYAHHHHHVSLYDYVTSIFLLVSVTAVVNRWMSKSNCWVWISLLLLLLFSIFQHYRASLFCIRPTKEWYARQTPTECLISIDISISSNKWIEHKALLSFIFK
jgi:hypothetical protein